MGLTFWMEHPAYADSRKLGSMEDFMKSEGVMTSVAGQCMDCLAAPGPLLDRESQESRLSSRRAVGVFCMSFSRYLTDLTCTRSGREVKPPRRLTILMNFGRTSIHRKKDLILTFTTCKKILKILSKVLMRLKKFIIQPLLYQTVNQYFCSIIGFQGNTR